MNKILLFFFTVSNCLSGGAGVQRIEGEQPNYMKLIKLTQCKFAKVAIKYHKEFANLNFPK